MEYRRAQSNDYDNIVALQNQNLISVVSAAEKSNGFLATAFSVEQFIKMNNEMCVVVCYDDNYLCGYLGSSPVDFNLSLQIPAEMVKRLKQIHYHGELMTTESCYIASPVCIDKPYRNQGIYLGLCQELAKYIPPKYDFALTLIADDNKRSLHATIQFGFEVIDQFTANNTLFHTLICSMSTFRKTFCENA